MCENPDKVDPQHQQLTLTADQILYGYRTLKPLSVVLTRQLDEFSQLVAEELDKVMNIDGHRVNEARLLVIRAILPEAREAAEQVQTDGLTSDLSEIGAMLNAICKDTARLGQVAVEPLIERYLQIYVSFNVLLRTLHIKQFTFDLTPMQQVRSVA